jgi:hypothetical protein
MSRSVLSLKHNGPAVEGVSVTRRSIRAVPIAIGTWYFSHKTVTSLTPDETSFIRAGLTERSERHRVRGEYSAVFAVRVQTLWSIRVWRYKGGRKQGTSQGAGSFKAGTVAVAV